ncbi:MAG TPA: phage holin family protein [Candidatus Limnocylindrales bacterium]|nr:phage holin family protein [Candidatus Limnocylindrales bacterium]
MKRGPVGRFILRWFVCSLGIWIASGILGQRVSYSSRIGVIVVAGLILAVVNVIIKPVVVILSLPAILFSLGLFMIVINGLMVLLVSKVYSPLHVTNFGAAMLAGMVIGLVNYLVTTILEDT